LHVTVQTVCILSRKTGSVFYLAVTQYMLQLCKLYTWE